MMAGLGAFSIMSNAQKWYSSEVEVFKYKLFVSLDRVRTHTEQSTG